MALSAIRNTPRREGDIQRGGVAASVVIFAGALLMRNAAGYLTKGAAATGSVGAGRAEQSVTGGAGAGDVSVNFRPGTFLFKNSASSDLITVAQIGDVCWIVDDETVAKTDGSAARSPAGFIEDVTSEGVWVRIDEVLTRVLVEGLANPA